MRIENKSPKKFYQLEWIHLPLFLSLFFIQETIAACGGTVRTWAGTNNNWNTASNWSPANIPNSASEDAVIVNSGQRARFTNNATVGCVDVQSGYFEGTLNRTITVVGDYFQAPNPNTLNITSNAFEIEMAGASAQTFEAVDDIRDLRLNNPTTVTLKSSFRILSDFIISGSGTTVIEGDLNLNNATVNQVIPAGHTIVIKNGASLFVSGGLTVNGVIQVEAGGELRIRRNETLTISSGGVLKLLGAAGNPAKIVSEASNRNFTFDMDGTLIANYFLIQRTDNTGMNVTGTISQLDNGEFRGIRNNGYAITLGAAAFIPSTMDGLGFYNDDAVASPFNINASAYNNGITTIDNYAGDVTGPTFETDGNNQITWNVPAITELAITDDTETNEPQQFMDDLDEFVFAEFAFSLTQTDTPTNITEVRLAMTGTASISDLDYVRAYIDTDGDCNADAGDTQVGGDLSFVGSPPTATITITPGDIQTSGPSDFSCLNIRARAGANPQDQKTVKFSIVSASDVTNSQSYPFSSTSGTPIETGVSIIRNQNFSSWDGTTDSQWNRGANWTGQVPSSTRDCQIGVGASDTAIDSNPVACANATLLANGVIDWGNTSNIFEVYSNLEIQSPYTFLNAANSIMSLVGTANQSLSLATAFPGTLNINNTGASGSNIIRVDSNSTINGNLVCIDGEIAIPDGVTLTVLGDVTIQSGCELSIEAGGILALGNTSTVTIDSGATLSMIGTSGSKAKMTSTSISNAYNVIVNGTIAAQYYEFDRLAASGVSIEAGASIDATYHLQDGTFTYPVNNSTTFLSLKRQVPTNTMDNMYFDTDGSGSSGIIAINTTGAAAGTLSITGYSGDSAGPGFDTSPTYNIAWSGATNTINLTREASSPVTVVVGNTYNMGRYGLKQSQAGASYSDTNITSIKLTLIGSGNANDVQNVSIFEDDDCNGAGGVLIGSGALSGNPASRTFTITPGDLVVQADLTTPPKTCFYVEYEISSAGVNGSTVGVSVALSTDIANSQSYALNSVSGYPLTLNTPSTIDAPTTTVWTGSTNTAWTTASNWTSGIPDLSKTCQIPNVANDPIISSGVATCKNVDITTGILTLNSGATLETYGNFTNTGTFNQSGNLEIEDGGSSTSHSISSTTLNNLHINKTGGGTISLAKNSQTINSLVVNGSNYILELASGKTLILPNGATLSGGLWRFKGGSIVEVGNGQTVLVSGGTFFVDGVTDAFPQNASTKAKFIPQGGTGSWNFTATSGSISINGFHFDRLGVNGINIGGTTAVTNLRGGQLTNLSTSYGSVKGIQLNTTGTLVTQMSNIAWNWGDFNSFDPANTNTPDNTENYQIISSTGCNSQTVDFTGWSGDWFEATPTFDVTTKVATSGCTINMGNSASAVSMHSLAAIPYNTKVDIRWETNTEQNHRGFNIYRSNADASEFIQINPTLIKNLFNTGQAKGKYRFVDADVENNKTFYYYVEDVEMDGDTTLHGPVFATPLATLGNPPATDDGQNDGSNPDDGDDGGGMGPFPIPNPSYKDLGNGAVILSQTSRSIRLEIIPATPLFSDSAWDNSFEDVAIQGYSKSTDEGKAELAERVLLIEVNQFAKTASLTNITVNESVLNGHKITPAPTYLLDGNGNLQPQYIIDSTYYSTNSFMPDSYIDLKTQLIKNAGKTYLSLKIKPLKFNPVNHKINFSNKIVLDIGLDGDAWDIDPPEPGSIINPYNIANTLKIAIDKAGVYQLDYDDLVSSEVEGPFVNADTDNLRLYLGTEELPIEVSSDGTFNSGDFIRFYTPYKKSLEDKFNRLILSTVNISDTHHDPLRIEHLDGNPLGQNDASESLVLYKKSYEQNLLYVDGESLDDQGDHFLWAGLLNYTGYDTLTFNVSMPELDTASIENVKLNFHVKGRLGIFFNYSVHHVALLVNGQEVDDIIFEENERRVLNFEIPADNFTAGSNSIGFKVLGTYAPSGDYDRVFVDKLDLEYVGYKDAGDGVSQISITETMSVHKVEGFTSNALSIYDTTDHLQTAKIIGSEIISLDAGATYQTRFYVDEFINDFNEKRISIIEGNNFLKPSLLSLNDGVVQSLKDINNRADYIIIGAKSLIESASELIAHRQADGLEVLSLTPSQIFGEFGQGNTSSSSIRAFIDYALSSWQVRPRYILLLGDATIDPLNHDVDDNGSDRSVLDSETLPMPVLDGRFIDFGADNYYVSTDLSHLPKVAIGRLPSNRPEEIYEYAQKLINYERSDSLPNDLNRMVFVADEDQEDYENFRQKIDTLAQSVTKFSSTIHDKAVLGSDAATKAAIINEFNQAPYMMTLMGHGAADRFSTNTFLVSDATESNLTHQAFPIVMTLNCESAYYFDATKSMKSLGETLVLNPRGGAIAYLGSTTQTTPPAQMRFAQNFLNLFNTSLSSIYKGQRLGDYFVQAKIATGSAEYEKDIINSFSIIGDPALRIPRELYATAQVAPVTAPKKGSGCSAGANDGSSTNDSWPFGLLEWMSYFLMIVLGRRLSKKYLQA